MRLGISWSEATSVVVSALAMYVALLVLLKVVGQRMFASSSGIDLAAAVGIGAVMGRAILGYTPTLSAGLVALGALFAAHRAVSALCRRGAAGLLGRAPVLLLAHGRPVPENLDRTSMTETELFRRLRQAGVRRPEEVLAAVLEPTGALTVLRRGERVDPRLLADVVGRELLSAA